MLLRKGFFFFYKKKLANEKKVRMAPGFIVCKYIKGEACVYDS